MAAWGYEFYFLESISSALEDKIRIRPRSHVISSISVCCYRFSQG